jgi:hypothetical protein
MAAVKESAWRAAAVNLVMSHGSGRIDLVSARHGVRDIAHRLFDPQTGGGQH